MSNPIHQYQTLIQDQPDNELLQFSLGKALFDAERFTEAEVHLRLALEKRKDWMLVAMLLARCARQRDDKKAAVHYYEYALPLAIAQKHLDPATEIREALAELKSL